MTPDAGCRGCRPEYRVTDERIRAMLAAPMFAPGSGLCVPDDIYEARLRQCRSCPKLIDGHTCALCGCIVPIVAKLKDRSCPAPGSPRWRRYPEPGA